MSKRPSCTIENCPGTLFLGARDDLGYSYCHVIFNEIDNDRYKISLVRIGPLNANPTLLLLRLQTLLRYYILGNRDDEVLQDSLSGEFATAIFSTKLWLVCAYFSCWDKILVSNIRIVLNFFRIFYKEKYFFIPSIFQFMVFFQYKYQMYLRFENFQCNKYASIKTTLLIQLKKKNVRILLYRYL